MQHKDEVLLVQPPVQHPALYAPAALRAEAALRGMGQSPVRFHAGADFAVNYLMALQVRRGLAERVRKHLRDGTYQRGPNRIRQQGERYAAGRDAVKETPPDASAMLTAEGAAVSDCTFLSMAQSIRRLDDALRLASLAYYPIRVDRRGLGHPDLDDVSALGAYLQDPDRNLFLEYTRHWCRPTVAVDACAAIVLVVATPGQLAGALTLARCWQEQRPTLPLAVHTPDERLQRVADRLFNGSAPFDAETDRRLRRAVRGADIPPSEPGGGNPAQGKMAQPDRVRGVLNVPLQPENEHHLPAAWRDGDGGVVVVWSTPRGTLTAISELLFRSAKHGHWNHLLLSAEDDPQLVDRLMQLADENPYIIHSWCRREPPASGLSDAIDRYPTRSPPYGETRPLPGRPLWQQLQDPVFLQACVAKHGPKLLARQRLSEDGGAVTTLGRRIAYRYLPPGELPQGYLDEICRMVEAGGTVGSRWLRHNLENAFLIGYAEENGIIVGNSSLKHPREAYVEAVTAQCGIDLRHYLERGYTSVRPEYRSMGVGAKLLEGLTARADGYKVYSVIAEDNVATQKMAIRNRTRKVASFFSERTHKQIGIWIPEWMLPEGVALPRQPDLV